MHGRQNCIFGVYRIFLGKNNVWRNLSCQKFFGTFNRKAWQSCDNSTLNVQNNHLWRNWNQTELWWAFSGFEEQMSRLMLSKLVTFSLELVFLDKFEVSPGFWTKLFLRSCQNRILRNQGMIYGTFLWGLFFKTVICAVSEQRTFQTLRKKICSAVLSELFHTCPNEHVPFISKLNSGDIITTGQYMNYQTFSNLQFIPLLKITFHTTHIDLRDTSGEKTPFVPVGTTRLVLMFRKASNIHF